MTPEQIIAAKPRFLRATRTRGAQPKVDRTGGDYGAGLIRGAALVTEGEALGHRMWLDRSFVEDVHKSVKSTGTKGLKMRFTHPGLSSDGMGSFLGRAKGGFTKDGITYADIHFAKSAHSTPDGDLASYVMNLAEEDPEAFGTSIVFEPDYGAEEKFVSEHKDEDGDYHSPDPNNRKNYPHARLARLRAADVVDEPAANPGGLFHRGNAIADEADKLLSFSLGLSEERPELCHLSIDPDRTAAFVARFLDSHGLEVKEKDMSEQKKDAATAPVTQESLDATLKAFGEDLLAKVDEKLAAQSKPNEGEDSEADVRAQERDRVSKIMAFAATSGLNDHAKIAQEAIDAGQSVESFKAGLADRLIAQNKMSKDGDGGEDKDPHAAFRAEFRANRDALSNLGIDDEDAYVRSRCRDEGMPVPAIKKAS